MRCLALADMIRDRGGETFFACALIPDNLARRIVSSGHGLARIDVPSELGDCGPGWERQAMSPEYQLLDAEATLRSHGDPPIDWIVVDHYSLDSRWEDRAIRSAGSVLAIDDLANRRHNCDILLDQSFGRDANAYRSLVPERCRVLAGTRFALLRNEFAHYRAASLERRQTPADVERILVSLGTTDVGGITARLLRDVLPDFPSVRFDVVLSPDAESLDWVTKIAKHNPHINIHIDANEMAQLMMVADMAIGAAGGTSWERCCLGVPSVTVVLADNQRYIAEQLQQAGAHRCARPEGKGLSAIVRSLSADPVGRTEMSRRAAEICDGGGTERVCNLMQQGLRMAS